MTEEHKDREWLRGQCVTLFETASNAEQPDVPVCTKLAELLFKLLPSGKGKQEGTDPLKRLRDEVNDGKQQG